jgi:2,3-bisphosphoglycerate-independent phosphoglycerate mutase
MIKPIILCILDGFGIREERENNAIEHATAPFITKLFSHFPCSRLSTSGLDVGLPEGQMGNSEVGHMSIGSGRILYQDLPKINASIKDGSFANNVELRNLIDTLKKENSNCHLFGLLSDGGVHSHQDHLITLAHIVSDHGIKVYLHLFLDGRDVLPESASKFCENLLSEIQHKPNISIATFGGRYYGMDRDNRWERTKLAFDAIVAGQGNKASDILAAIDASYKQNITDEFIVPTVLESYNGIKEGDGLIMANFRSDRVRQILTSILDPEFKHFPRNYLPNISIALGMTEYSSQLNNFMKALFKQEKITNTLPEIVAKAGLKQLRIAETEKYAHVTFFFNGGSEEKLPGEKRILIPSPEVATYDLKPEMSAYELTERLINEISADKFDLIIVNYANSDMVGHTGNFSAAVKAIEALDKCLSEIYKTLEQTDGVMLITADHGNIEQMQDIESSSPHTSHTTNPVPFIMVGKNIDKNKIKLQNGRLCDIAPTILELMGLEKPKEMLGKSLIVK